MERKDWLYVALHLIIILMLLLVAGNLATMEKKFDKKEEREQALRECEFIKEAKELVDNPAFYEVASPDTIKFYEKYARLYPLIEDSYRLASDDDRGVPRIAAWLAMGDSEGYARYMADRLFGRE